MTEIATAPLTGKALLQKIKSSGDLPRRELAKLCGYYTVTKGGETRINLAEFYDSVLAAKGIELEKSKGDGRGREASYRTTVHKNGSIVIGASYTQEMGLKPGDEFEIKLGYKHIRLVQIDTDTLEGLEEEGDE
ncbi:MAG: AbrB family transcriptional regulator [Actinomycetota bacterium]